MTQPEHHEIEGFSINNKGRRWNSAFEVLQAERETYSAVFTQHRSPSATLHACAIQPAYMAAAHRTLR